MSDPTAAGITTVGNKGYVTSTELDRHERAVARRSAEARAIVPSIEFSAEVAMEASLALEAELECGMTALLLAATARALSRAPRINGSYRDGAYEHYSRINIGVTIADGDLLVIPTVFDADTKSAVQIGAELSDYSERARRQQLTPAELSGATFTLTDLSAGNVTVVTPLIVPPQAAALAAGPIRKVPVAKGGEIVVGEVMVLSLACDHRIVFGDHATAFLEEVKTQLEEATG